MVCIYCGGKTKTTNSRGDADGLQTWRRKQCQKCNALFTTYEVVSTQDCIMVNKNNGSLEPFSRDKIYISIYNAINHLPDVAIKSTALTETVLRHVFKNKPLPPTISTKEIAKTVAKILKNYNAAASVRYQSYQTPLNLPSDIKKSLR